MPRDRLWRRAVMARSGARRPAHPAVEPQALPVKPMTERPGAQPGFGRNFGFLVHDVSRLIKRRFDRRARQTGLPITRRQAAVILYIAPTERVSRTEVASSLDMEPIALARMLDKLHQAVLVERRAHP